MSGKNAKNLVIVFLIVVATGFVYHVLTNVTKKDMIAFLDLDKEVNLDVMEPGDIVAISPDGQRHERICEAQEVETRRQSRTLHRAYYNSLGQVLPSFPSIIGASGEGGNEGIDASEVTLHGEVRGLRTVGTAGNMYAEGCACEIARRMLLRNTVCQVKASLIEYSASAAGDKVARTVAVKYPTYANVVSEKTFKDCGLTYNPTIEGKARICGGTAHSWDVRLRRAMNLIEERPLPPVAFTPAAPVNTAALGN